ncbi:hypothetical protein QKU58_gp028 [Pyramimonas orientalis virus]|uniref:Uncharacterized protein n=1 Tax=Pyramimonas orientalis virus 01B TaxID=3134525 RepID=A0A7M3UNN2_9VIRU|nr:hypothetical protein QKU58_gp028 [Pyramimonas orientalis virus]QOI90303.1 hypothetical protein HWQ62_00166 [Pyramimonas orientalis virus]
MLQENENTNVINENFIKFHQQATNSTSMVMHVTYKQLVEGAI